MESEELEEEYNVGNLVSFRNMNQEQVELFIKLISDESSYLFQVLFNVLEDDDAALQLIDIFAGQKIQFPSRKKIYKLLERIKIYTYVKSKGYSQESIQLLAKQYKRRNSQIKSYVDRIDYLLANGKYRELENLEDLEHIK